MPNSRRVTPELSSGAMADIAFLLLTFYMVTTEIKEYKGLTILLPKGDHEEPVVQKNERNLFSIRINSFDQILVEGQPVQDLTGVRDVIKKFVMNYKKDPKLSDSPEEAVVSIKTDRGTTYKRFIAALDEAQAAYCEIYAERAGITPAKFRALDLANPTNKRLYDKARAGIPMNISIAEPTAVGN